MNRTLVLAFALAVCVAGAARTSLERKLERAGYVDVEQVVDGVFVDLMYASPDNFTGVVLYDSLSHAYLHPDAARAFARAAHLLRSEEPALRLLVRDAARPVSVQRRMFGVVRGTPHARYVANPATGGGTHNFGLAVDVTLCDSLGRELDMGTPVDFFGPEAHIDHEDALLRAGSLGRGHVQRRRLLRKVMRAAGFKTIRKEWWHFELRRRAEAAARYRLIDF